MVSNPFTNVDNAKIRRGGHGILAALFVAFLALPLVTEESGLLRLVLLAFIWSGYAAAWNLFSGFSGYISFGHAVFFGLGGFVSTVLLADHGITPWIGMIAGAFAAVAAALVIGVITFRAGLSGIYFALSVLAFPLILAPVLIWLGYIEVSVPFNPDQAYYYMSFRGMVEYYYIALALFTLTMAVAWKVQRSRLGFYLQAINSSEEAAESLGVNTFRYKLYALSLSAFLSGLLGTVYIQINYIFATEGIFSVNTSAQPVILAVAGGLGTLFGPLFAGLTLFPLAETLRATYGSAIPGIHHIIYGVVLIAVIIFFPDGLYVGIRDLLLGEEGEPERADNATVTEEE